MLTHVLEATTDKETLRCFAEIEPSRHKVGAERLAEGPEKRNVNEGDRARHSHRADEFAQLFALRGLNESNLSVPLSSPNGV